MTRPAFASSVCRIPAGTTGSWSAAPCSLPPIWPTMSSSGQPTRRWGRWCTWRGRDGRSRSASRRPKGRSAWTSTRCGAGPGGTGTSRSRSWPMRISPSRVPRLGSREKRGPSTSRRRATWLSSSTGDGKRSERSHPLECARAATLALPGRLGRRAARHLHPPLVPLASPPSGSRQGLPLPTASGSSFRATTTVVLVVVRNVRGETPVIRLNTRDRW
jgi:hypothetical protein